MRTALVGILVALLACLVVIGSWPDESSTTSVADGSRGPSFEVRVVIPRLGQPLFGMLPQALANRLEWIPGEVGFDDASRGAAIGGVARDRLELSAEGWDLSLETDGAGRIASGTHLVFPLAFEEKRQRLRCRPADGDSGHLRTTERPGGDELGGTFLVELSICEYVDSGETVATWPPAPLTVLGSFDRLPRGAD